MSLLEMPSPSDVLRAVVEGSVYSRPDRFSPLLQDIRSLLRSLGGDVTAGSLAHTVRQGVYFLRTAHQRRDLMAEFFESYPVATTAAEILKTMEQV
ncbi:hypothetical protein HK16_10770 [Acetobacter senegalensis]|uniref:Uncharacterized protein n=2 Tax=Acetobacter TaxID=434 RepID=A0A252EIN4_9PROT|nr:MULTISPECIES: hypothetical protein [Acetobacter]ATJ89399.1 hypothetical protein CIW82_00375 [Acetobacter tropicalis]OUL66351.1 hypothetical protein HK16_10770 [Acetobacter senegalensis]